MKAVLVRHITWPRMTNWSEFLTWKVHGKQKVQIRVLRYRHIPLSVCDKKFESNVKLHANTIITLVNKVNDTFQITTGDGQTFDSKVQPLFAGGFDGSHKFVSHLFETRKMAFQKSTKTMNRQPYLEYTSVDHP